MSGSSTTLTSSEYVQLTLNAIARGQTEESIELSRRAVQEYPEAADARYLLGAQYAQIGMYDKAEAEMARALESDPSLAPARFQLGLLLLTQGRLPEAFETWEPLESLDAEHPLRLFQHGLRCMVNDNFDDARALLQRGIERNPDNEALNHDMRRVIGEMELAPTAPAPAETQHVLLSAYRDR